MRLDNYLVEGYISNTSRREIENIIRTKIKKSFLNAVKEEGYLYRGTNFSEPGEIYNIKTSHLEGRKPMSTERTTHTLLNKFFKKIFGWKVRNGIFVSGNPQTAMLYGYILTVFFPLDEYEFCWNPEVKDLYTKVPTKNVDEFNELKAKNLVEGYRATNLREAIRKGVEISFKCDKYLVIKKSVISKINLREML